MNDQPAFWFPVKRYGWGWGLPVRWQGWVVFASYLLLTLAGINYFRARDSVAGLLIYLLVLTAVLVTVVVIKGERPAGWRWGKK